MNKDQHIYTEGDVNLSKDRKEWSDLQKDAKTLELLDRDARVFMHQALSTPCLDVLEFSEGIYLKNAAGKNYMDFHGNNVHQLGYGNTFILNRVKKQLDTLAFSPRRFTNEPIVELAERLTSLTDGALQRVLFAPGGTSAISMALKIARFVTGKHKTIAMYDSFHGASIDNISLGGEYVFQKGLGPLLAGSIHVPAIDTYKGLWYNPQSEFPDKSYADYICYVMEKEGDIGALVLETVRSTVIHPYSNPFWKQIRDACDRYQVLLILDEIPIGMGRTGKMFAFEHTGIVPDILALGKGLGAGIIPMAAVLCKEELNVASEISLGHFTHEKSPIGAAAALAALDYMQEKNLFKHIEFISNYMSQRLDELKNRYPLIGDVRGIGMLWAIELVEDPSTKEKANAKASQLLYHCLKNGLSLKVSDGNVISLYPPLTINMEEMDQALNILEAALSELNNLKPNSHD